MPPYNGSGTYTLTAGQPVVAGTDILDSTFNTLTADLATALSTCVTRDGQSPPTTNLPMGSFKLTGLAAGTAAGHSVRFEQLQTGVNKLITVAGTGDVITGVMTPTYGAYTNGDMFTFIVGATNTTNVTINLDGLGAKAITNGTTALTAGALTANRVVVIQYDGTRFQLLNSYLVTPITGTTGSTVVPVGTTAQRDAAPSAGYVRYNTSTSTFEGYGSAWGALGGTDYLNTTRIDVASATTLDLTANAPNTRNIRLTGTTTITGVTVAIGQTYFVVASGAFTLTNNASIVTNTGANIVAAVGDSFVLRSTAADTVEVIEYARITLPVANGGTGVTTAIDYGFRNRIINGSMVIDQRNAGASVTPSTTGGGTYTLDRWFAQVSQNSKLTVQQNAGSVTPPVGFSNYLGVTSSSSYSITSGDYFSIRQAIEGYNIADLGWGTASAKTVTISFWVYSSLTGTFGATVQNASINRTYPFTYSIPVANTWTQISATVAGDTSGTWGTTNGVGISLAFGLGVGSTYSATAGSWAAGNYISATGATSVVATNGATFYITGVQLEKGSTATSFDYRPYGTELALCQRYCIKYGGEQVYNKVGGLGYAIGTTTAQMAVQFPVQMRTTPTLTTTGNFKVSDGVTTTAMSTISISTTESSSTVGFITPIVASGLTQYRPYMLQTDNSTTANAIFSAEL